MKTKIIYNGRADGLGNRIEEIVWLEAVCDKLGIEILYNWNNLYRHRKYPVLFEAKQVRLSKRKVTAEQGFFSPPPEIRASITQADILTAAKRIKPKFDIRFADNVKPLGIHIRGTDRIGKDHPHFMEDHTQFSYLLSKTLKMINESRPTHLFICADDTNYKNQLMINVDQQIKIVEPVCAKKINREYRDFFALTLCKEICMCSKFSSFSICASLIGNIPLVSFFQSEEFENRYKAIFSYDLEELRAEEVRSFEFANSVPDPPESKLEWLKKGFADLFKSG